LDFTKIGLEFINVRAAEVSKRLGKNSLSIASLWLTLNFMVHNFKLEIVYFKCNAVNNSELPGNVEKRVVQ
jgi:hypothetical protein